jgi:septum formation protein
VLVLASRSPQRRAILEQLGIEFRAVVPDVEELTEGHPAELALENARRKAAAVEGYVVGGDLVLGVDTVVVLDGRVYGKPSDAAQAELTLGALAGSEHHVLSGIALRDAAGGERTDVAVTRVRFRALEPRELAWYLESGEWRERAGGYAIQGKGAALVEEIEGDYWNVVGLPVPALLRLAPDLIR